MKLYEINEQLEALLSQTDPETGEITVDLDALLELQMAREEKLEGIALMIKERKAMADALKAEEERLKARRKTYEASVDYLKELLLNNMDGRLETPRVRVTTRRNAPTMEIQDEKRLMAWAETWGHGDWLKVKEPELDKAKVRKAIQDGEQIPFVVMKDNISLVMK